MARDFAKAFYNSDEWKRCRARYIQLMPREKRGLCERCYEQGKHERGVELHHKIWLTPSNINDRDITLNHKHLILLCRDCHRDMHGQRNPSRYIYNDMGELIPNPRYAPIENG